MSGSTRGIWVTALGLLASMLGASPSAAAAPADGSTCFAPSPEERVVRTDNEEPVSYPAAEIVEVCARYTGEHLNVSMRTAQPTDPLQDRNWESDNTLVTWFLATEGAATPITHDIIMLRPASEPYLIVSTDRTDRSPENPSTPCGSEDAEAGYANGWLTVTGMPAACFGSPTSLRIGSAFQYQEHGTDRVFEHRVLSSLFTHELRPPSPGGEDEGEALPPTPCPSGSSSPEGQPSDSRPLLRLAGADRYTTAVKISACAFPDGSDVVFVATGEDFPDALSGAAAAASLGAPVLLTSRDRLPGVTAEELRRLRPSRVFVLGGPAAVSDAAADAAWQAVGDRRRRRLAGDSRFATSVAISSWAFPDGAPVVYVASGSDFPDALAGGAAAGRQGAPVLLVTRDEISEHVRQELARLRPRQLVILGGHAAISEAVEAELAAATGAQLRRLSGPDRYATAAAIANAVSPGSPSHVLIASADSDPAPGRFPDALAGAPGGVVWDAPLLLAPGNGPAPAAVLDALDRLDPGRTATLVVLGGAAAISHTTARAMAEH